MVIKTIRFVRIGWFAYQLMANELKMPHVLVSTFYGILQLAISSLFLNFTEFRWYYVVAVLLALCTVYILFMRRFFHLHLQRMAV